MDHTGTIRDDTRASPSFTDLRKALLSTDDAAYQAYRTKWLADGQLRFLDGKPLPGERTMYNSFQRSGNTFLRRYLELISGIATGSEVTLRCPWPL